MIRKKPMVLHKLSCQKRWSIAGENMDRTWAVAGEFGRLVVSSKWYVFASIIAPIERSRDQEAERGSEGKYGGSSRSLRVTRVFGCLEDD
jgi:hypothetical protein